MGQNQAMLPVVGFSSEDKTRNIVQFALSMLKSAPYVAIRLEGQTQALDKNIDHVRSILNAVSDDDFKRIALIIDRGSIHTTPSLQDGSSIMKCMKLLTEFPIKNTITLSTSWPHERPDGGKSAQPRCMDPSWQARLHSNFALQSNFAYGDYAATNPTFDVLDDYDPKIMSQPIPFAGYFTRLSWHQERRGAGGENEKFQEIAQIFQQLPGYHGVNFCWGTKMIHDIATGQRKSSGNMAFWNKIRVNQHICAMLHDLDAGLLTDLVSPREELDEELDEDLI